MGVFCTKSEDGNAYWDLSPTVCGLIGVQFDYVNGLLTRAGIKSLGQTLLGFHLRYFINLFPVTVAVYDSKL